MAIERHGETEEMRHVPPFDFLIDRLGGELRFRVTTLLGSSLRPGGSLPQPIEQEFRAIIRWLDRLADVVRHHRSNGHGESDLRSRLDRAFENAIHALANVDRNHFRRRAPFHLFERSRGEQAFAAFLAAYRCTVRLEDLVAAIDPDVRLKLVEKMLPKFPDVA